MVFHADGLDQELGRKHIEARLADPLMQPPIMPPDPKLYNVDVST